jgi:hypothetical protein
MRCLHRKSDQHIQSYRNNYSGNSEESQSGGAHAAGAKSEWSIRTMWTSPPRASEIPFLLSADHRRYPGGSPAPESPYILVQIRASTGNPSRVRYPSRVWCLSEAERRTLKFCRILRGEIMLLRRKAHGQNRGSFRFSGILVDPP